MSEFHIEVAGLENKQEIYDLFLNNYFPKMPLFAAIGVNTPLSIDEWPALQTLKDGLTLKAVSKDGEIMGYAINVLPKDGECVGIPPQLTKFFDFVDTDSEGLLSKLEKNMLELRVMCVNEKHQGKGIATKLVEESENLAKKVGKDSIFGMATNAYMELAFKKRGWSCLYRLNYKEYLKEDKNFILPPEPHNSVTVYQKNL